MALLRFFDAEKALLFAQAVVDEYRKVHVLVDSSKKHLGRKPERTVAVVKKISSFTRAEKLNFYVRAKMFAEIKNGLRRAGIDETEVDEFIRAVTIEGLRRPM